MPDQLHNIKVSFTHRTRVPCSVTGLIILLKGKTICRNWRVTVPHRSQQSLLHIPTGTECRYGILPSIQIAWEVGIFLQLKKSCSASKIERCWISQHLTSVRRHQLSRNHHEHLVKTGELLVLCGANFKFPCCGKLFLHSRHWDTTEKIQYL